MRVGPNCAELSTLLNEIDVPHYEAAVITDLSTESGTTPKRAPEGCIIASFGLLANAHGHAHFIAPGPRLSSSPFLNRASPRVTYS
jgi:hypothetical protein